MAKKLPIKMAQEVVRAYGLKEVIILCRDEEGTQHIVTAGDNKKTCKLAGESGDMLKKLLAWPEETRSKYTAHLEYVKSGNKLLEHVRVSLCNFYRVFSDYAAHHEKKGALDKAERNQKHAVEADKAIAVLNEIIDGKPEGK